MLLLPSSFISFVSRGIHIMNIIIIIRVQTLNQALYREKVRVLFDFHDSGFTVEMLDILCAPVAILRASFCAMWIFPMFVLLTLVLHVNFVLVHMVPNSIFQIGHQYQFLLLSPVGSCQCIQYVVSFADSCNHFEVGMEG